MEEFNKSKKNHWTQLKVDGATKKINQDIYQRKRQAPLQLKMDDMAIYINDKITRRGIAKGLVCIQEDLNRNILKAQKKTLEAIFINNIEKQHEYGNGDGSDFHKRNINKKQNSTNKYKIM